MPPKPRTLDPAVVQAVETLLEQDPPLSFAKIGKEAGCSPASVKKIADELGIDRSSPKTAAANASRRNIAAARRAALELDFLDDVDAARNLFHAAIAQNDGRTAKDAMWAAAQAFEKSQRIADSAAQAEGIEAATSMLGDLAAAISEAFSDDEEGSE